MDINGEKWEFLMCGYRFSNVFWEGAAATVSLLCCTRNDAYRFDVDGIISANETESPICPPGYSSSRRCFARVLRPQVACYGVRLNFVLPVPDL